jgi:hypothetical protein
VVRVAEVFPPGLLDREREDDVVVFLRGLPIDPEDRKQLLVEWCHLVGAVLTRDLVERAGAE